MNIEYYYNFVRIVESGTISKAAKELMIAQPALSIQLKTLENFYGTQLITRGAHHIHLTDTGKILYENAKKICLISNSIYEDINLQVRGKKGTLHIGLCPYYKEPSIFDPLQAFSTTYPEMNFDIYEESSSQIMFHLKNGDIELGVVHSDSAIPSCFKIVFFVNEHYLVGFRKENSWIEPKKKVLPLISLKGIPLSCSRGIYNKIMNCCLKSGFVPKIYSQSTTRSLSLTWAVNGKCVAIFPTLVSVDKLNMNGDGLWYRCLRGANLKSNRCFIMMRNHKLSPTAQIYLEYTKEYFKQNHIDVYITGIDL
jgi:DNA-binding transcriptional LysR family regulator